MKPLPQPFLTLACGIQIPIAEAHCLNCRRLLAASMWDGRLVIWDALGFTDDGLIRFHEHACRSARRRDLVLRGSKLGRDANDWWIAPAAIATIFVLVELLSLIFDLGHEPTYARYARERSHADKVMRSKAAWAAWIEAEHARARGPMDPRD